MSLSNTLTNLNPIVRYTGFIFLIFVLPAGIYWFITGESPSDPDGSLDLGSVILLWLWWILLWKWTQVNKWKEKANKYKSECKRYKNKCMSCGHTVAAHQSAYSSACTIRECSCDGLTT